MIDWLMHTVRVRRHSGTIRGAPLLAPFLHNGGSAQGYFSIRARMAFSLLDKRWASGRVGANAIINHFSYFPDAKTHRRELWQGARPPCCRVTPPFFSQHRWSISPTHNRRAAIWEIYSLFHAEKVNISSNRRVINFLRVLVCWSRVQKPLEIIC